VGEFSVASCESVLCVSGLSVFVHVELFFVACGCVVVVGELAVASCGSVLCVSGLSVFVHVELHFVACGCVVVVGEFGSGFSWKLTARVETQAHLALRCDSEWGMHKRSASLKTLCPLGAFVVSFSSCFYSELLLARRLLRHGRLRDVFNVLGVDEGLLSMHGSSVLRERAFDLRARTASAQG